MPLVGAISLVVATLAFAGGVLYADSVSDEVESRRNVAQARRRALRQGRAEQRAIDRERRLAEIGFFTFEQGQRQFDRELEQRRARRRA